MAFVSATVAATVAAAAARAAAASANAAVSSNLGASRRARRTSTFERTRARVQLQQPPSPSDTSSAVDEMWSQLARQMREEDQSASLEQWHELLKLSAQSNELEKGVYFLDMMKKTERSPTAASYDILLTRCAEDVDARKKRIAFYLVEKMYEDKISLGDVTIPEGLEKTLRALLPPEAFQ